MAFFFGKEPMIVIDYNEQATNLKQRIMECKGTNTALRESIKSLITNGTRQNSINNLLNQFKKFTQELQSIRNSIDATQKRFKNDISRIKYQPIKNSSVQQYIRSSMFSNKYTVRAIPPINKMQSILDTIRATNIGAAANAKARANANAKARVNKARANANVAAKAAENKRLQNLQKQVNRNSAELNRLNTLVTNNRVNY